MRCSTNLMFFKGFRNAGFQPLDEDIHVIKEENGFERPIPFYIENERLIDLADGFMDEPININNAKEVYTCLVQYLDMNL